MRRLAAFLIPLALVSGCTGEPQPSPSPSEAMPSAFPEPGRPYDAEALLDEMSASRRPGGVPAQLQTDAVASALAAQIWTFNGEPWDVISIGGSCGPVRCTLDVGGSMVGSSGEDLWTFEVIPASAGVAVIDSNLRSLPTEAADDLDALARAGDDRIRALGLILTSARWAPPPDSGVFGVSYRSGNEEGSCELELTVAAESGAVEQESATGC